MKEKNLPLDYQHSSLEELTEKVNSIIESLENEKNLNNSVDSYQELLKLNNLIENKEPKSISIFDRIFFPPGNNPYFIGLIR